MDTRYFPILSHRERWYPRIITCTVLTTIAIFILSGNGWQGPSGHILFIDYLVFYAGGILYESDPGQLYNAAAQQDILRRYLSPIPINGAGVFSHPPYTAPLFRLLSLVKPDVGLILFLIASAVSLYLLIWTYRQITSLNTQDVAPYPITLSMALSSAPVILCLYSGQMSLLIGGIVGLIILAFLKGQDVRAGILVGLLCVKPQFALPFIIIFLGRRSWRALAGAASIPGILTLLLIRDAGSTTALQLFVQYIHLIRALSFAPYIEGLPSYLLMTPFAFTLSLVPEHAGKSLSFLSIILTAAGSGILLYGAHGSRAFPSTKLTSLLAIALLYPVVFTPYCMLYDLSILVLLPALVPTLFHGSDIKLWNVWMWISPFIAAATGILIGAAFPIKSVLRLLIKLLRDEGQGAVT